MSFNKVFIKQKVVEKLMMLSSKHTDTSAIQIALNEQQWMFEIGAEFAQSYHSWTSMCFHFTKANFHPNDWSVFLFKINTPQFCDFDANGQLCAAATPFSQAPRWIAFACLPSKSSDPKVQVVNNVFHQNLYLIWDFFYFSLKKLLFPEFPKIITSLDITRLIDSISANMCFDNIKENNLSLLTVLSQISNVAVEENNKTAVIAVKKDTENQICVKSLLKDLPEISNSAITESSKLFPKVKFSDSIFLTISRETRRCIKFIQKFKNLCYALKIVLDTPNRSFDLKFAACHVIPAMNVTSTKFQQALKIPICKTLFSKFITNHINLNEFAIFVVKYYTQAEFQFNEKPYFIAIAFGPPVEPSKSPMKAAFIKSLSKIYDLFGTQLLVSYNAENSFPEIFGTKSLSNIKKQISSGDKTVFSNAMNDVWKIVEKDAIEKLNNYYFSDVNTMAENLTINSISEGIMKTVYGSQ